MPRKKKKCVQEKTTQHSCIIHFSQFKNQKVTPLTDVSFKKIRDVANIRRLQPGGSRENMVDICKGIPDSRGPNHGYHRQCYMKFTLMKYIKTSGTSTAAESKKEKQKRKSGDEKDTHIFFPNCIFCEKDGSKYIKTNDTSTREHFLEFKEEDDYKTVICKAEEKKDEKLLCRIRDIDLRASRAKYHRSCRKAYNRNPSI